MVSPFVTPPLLELSSFKGPFDLLYQLLQKGEIPWREVLLKEVALGFEASDEVEEKGAFLSHFVHLTWLKVQTLFPTENPEMEEKEGVSIFEMIESYTLAVQFREVLEQQESLSSLIYRRALMTPPPPKKGLEGVDLSTLQTLFEGLVQKYQVPFILPKEVEWSLERTLQELMISLDVPLSFNQIFSLKRREEWIALFLSLLEGIKQEKIGLSEQDGTLYFVRAYG